MKFFILKLIMLCMSVICSYAHRKRYAPQDGKIKRIVVCHFGGIGDMIIATPALRALANKYEKSKISFICSNINNCMFLTKFPFIVDVRAFNVYALDLKGLLKRFFWRELRDIIEYLRSEPIDLLVNFHHPVLIDWFLMEFIMVVLSGAKYSVGANPQFLKKRSIYNKWVSESNLEGKHYKDFFLEIVELLGVVAENRDTEFPLSEDDRLFIEIFVRQHNLESKKFVCIHPGSSEPNKLWPAERYRQLCLNLTNNERKVILVGSKEDFMIGEMISKRNPNVFNLIGKTNISQTAALIEKCSVFIGNDSGPFHISIGVKTPTIGLIGPGYPRFHLYSREDIQVIKKEVSCSPCRNWNCKDKYCMTQIEVEEVLRAAEDMLNRFNQGKIIDKRY